jgi:hypothetical protein
MQAFTRQRMDLPDQQVKLELSHWRPRVWAPALPLVPELVSFNLQPSHGRCGIQHLG